MDRATKYGDGFFETILVYNGKIPFIEFHLDRIFKTAQFLAIQMPRHIDKIYFEKLIKEQGIQKGVYRLRVQFSRAGAGFYFPESNQISIEKGIVPLTLPYSLINRFNHPIHFLNSIKSSNIPYWNFKTCNSHAYILPAIEAQKLNLPDGLLLNNENQPIEWIYSNLFIYENRVLTTPPLGSGCVDGVMRRALVEWCRLYDFQIVENPITRNEVEKATLVLKTNALTGISISGDANIDSKLLKLLTNFQSHYLSA